MSEITASSNTPILCAAAGLDAVITDIESRLTEWATETGTALAALSAKVSGTAVDKLVRPVVEELVRTPDGYIAGAGFLANAGLLARNAATSPGGRVRIWNTWTPWPTSAPTPSAAT